MKRLVKVLSGSVQRVLTCGKYDKFHSVQHLMYRQLALVMMISATKVRKDEEYNED